MKSENQPRTVLHPTTGENYSEGLRSDGKLTLITRDTRTGEYVVLIVTPQIEGGGIVDEVFMFNGVLVNKE